MKIIWPLMAIFFAMYIHSNSESNIKYGIVNAKSGLNLRENSSISSKKITTIPYKSIIFIIQINGPNDVINGVEGNWYNVRFNGEKGWVWGQYIDIAIKDKYQIKQFYRVIEGQSVADISFLIYEDNKFEIQFCEFLSESSKESSIVSFTGSWKMENEYYLLTFTKKYCPKCLFFNPNGEPYTDKIEMIDDYQFKYKKDLHSIKIWDLPCYLTEIQ